MADRAAYSSAFLQSVGWGAAARHFLAGDASDRSYDRLTLPGLSAVLMDAPPGKGDDPAQFLKIADHLSRLGLSAPLCLAQDLPNGFLLLEDLGDGVFARLLNANPASEPTLYTLATEVLVRVQSSTPPPDLPNLSAEDWAKAACFALEWYRFSVTGERCDPTRFRAALTEALLRHADGPRVMILRDYHAENLLWLPERTGLAQVGLLDFQLAQMGQPGYDLVSLLQDARRDVSEKTEAAMVDHFVRLGGFTDADFRLGYATLGAQRALRILGIFARLCLQDAKSSYLALMPRVWAQLWRNLSVPELSDLAKVCADLLPAPTPENLALIGVRCGHFR